MSLQELEDIKRQQREIYEERERVMRQMNEATRTYRQRIKDLDLQAHELQQRKLKLIGWSRTTA